MRFDCPRIRDAHENPMRASKVNKLVSNNRVGESRDGSVRGEEEEVQQAEKNEDSATQKKSRKSGRREEMMMMRSSAQKAFIVQKIGTIVERQCRRPRRSIILLKYTIVKLETQAIDTDKLKFFHGFLQFSSNHTIWTFPQDYAIRERRYREGT